MPRLTDAERQTLNRPIARSRARYNGRNGVSIMLDGVPTALATTSMAAGLSDPEQAAAARRIAALWNAMLDVPTDQIETCKPR